jgi:hypothetical protein
MQLVRVQDMGLAGQALPGGAAKAEALRAGERQADAVSVVTMRREGLAVEMRLQALDAVGTGNGADAVAPPAYSFVSSAFRFGSWSWFQPPPSALIS